jgi:hypothetical protein
MNKNIYIFKQGRGHSEPHRPHGWRGRCRYLLLLHPCKRGGLPAQDAAAQGGLHWVHGFRIHAGGGAEDQTRPSGLITGLSVDINIAPPRPPPPQTRHRLHKRGSAQPCQSPPRCPHTRSSSPAATQRHLMRRDMTPGLCGTSQYI